MRTAGNGRNEIQRVRVIDSHTEGEPTRVVISGGPDLGSGTASDRLERFRQCHDGFRDAVVNEPRGHRAMVGALLCEPHQERALTQVIFFNNVGWLGMCGHGTIGVATTLAWLGRIEPGSHRLETPVGDVKIVLRADGIVSVRNVASYRWGAAVAVQTRHHGTITGDVAWGGNWFFLVSEHRQRLELANLEALTALCQDVRSSLAAAGITGASGAEIDHIELFGDPSRPDADSRNFVLCPGGEYDRSPCGTGTSAKMACLWADGRLAPGATWRQEGITGGLFTGSFELADGKVLPTISGRAWVTSEAELVLQADDPLRQGIRAP